MLDDYELLYLARENNEYAIEELYKKYNELMHIKTKKYTKNNYFYDDYLNEALIGFYDAINNYNDNTKFITFLNACIDNKLYNYKVITNRKKFSILANAISIEESEIPSNILIDKKNNPEDLFFENIKYKDLKRNILNNLNYQEELIFLLKEQGFTIKEISKIIDKRIQIVYQNLKSIKNKINKIITN